LIILQTSSLAQLVKAEALAVRDYQGCWADLPRGAFSIDDDDPARLERNEPTSTTCPISVIIGQV
jgi:hypothetical protein